jgi:hypothetical protein
MNPEPLCQFFVGPCAAPYFPNFYRSKRRIMVFLSISGRRQRQPPLYPCISNIVLVRTDKQMLWIYARRDITLMANAHSLGNFPLKNLVRDPVRVSLFLVWQRNGPVPPIIFPLLPYPAPILVFLDVLQQFLPNSNFFGLWEKASATMPLMMVFAKTIAVKIIFTTINGTG